MPHSKVIFTFILFTFFLASTYSQGEWNNWHFGVNSGITFNYGAPIAIPFYPLMCNPGGLTSSISDSLGNFLFYSNGWAVYDKNYNLMPNGWGLNGQGSRQPAFAFPMIGETNKYYLFTVPSGTWTGSFPIGLRYSILDMSLNGGLGDIVNGMKNLSLPLGDSVIVQLTAIRHHNNHDVWVIVRRHGSNCKYLAYLVSSSGINTPIVSNTELPGNSGFGDGHLRVSPDGTKLVCSSVYTEICNFDDETGVVSPLFLLPPNPSSIGGFGVEFSIDSKYLYLTEYFDTQVTPHFVYQFDASITDSVQFLQSQVVIGSSAGSSIQMGPDGKIYLDSFNGSDSLSVINAPSLPGLFCNFQLNAIPLNGNISNGCLSQFLQKYNLYIHYLGNCSGNLVQFSATIWPHIDSVRWNFGDPISGLSNFSNVTTPSHSYSSPGNYIVELYVRHSDNRTDTTWQVVAILPSPQPSIGYDRTICTGNSVTFDAGFCSGCVYEWKNVASGLVVSTNQTFTTGTVGIYCVNVVNGNGCSGSDTVQLMTTPTPVVTNIPPLMKTICSGESTNIPLFGNEPGIIFHWTATLSSGNISGYSADSGQVINQTLINNNATAGVVTYHITPKIGDCAGTPVDYAVSVNVGDPVDVSISASVNNVCAGIPVTFNATPTNPGSNPAYQWKVNAASAGLSSPVFTYIPDNGDVVQCILTSSNTVCVSNNPATSNSITMVVNPLQPVSIVVSPTANPVCAGTPVTLNAVPTNGGTIPVYQWKVNGINTGSNLPVFSYIPVNGDAVSCVLTSNSNCPTGNPASSIPINMIVNPLLSVSISISPSANPFCLGNPVTYTAVPVNGGPSPNYQWKVNGTNAGLNNALFTYSPANGDAVTCVLNSSESCPTGNPASSNSITMVVNTSLPTGLAITASANPFCPGSSVVFTASPVNGGSVPVYQWKVNGTNVGSNTAAYTYSPVNGDSVRCVMTSNLNCVTGNPASSAKIIMLGTLAPTVIFTSCFDTLTTVIAKPYKLKGGIPLGGTYSGPGVNSVTGTFTPSNAGTGLKNIVYTYTNVALCSANKSKTIIVQTSAPFTCGNNLTDIRDAKTYPTVQIGTQCWMAANLNYGNQISPSQVQFDNCIAEKYCYNDNPLNCTNNGGLYQWDEMMKYDDTPAGQGLCPPGWHVPTETDWTTLFNFYLGNALAGKPLQDSNITGFKALTSGVYYLNSSWSFNGFATLFWSSTPWNTTKGISHGLNVYDYSVSLYPSSRANAFPVRCTRD